MGLLDRVQNKLLWEWQKYSIDHCPKYAVRKKWKEAFGRSIDLENPKTLNEKIEWLVSYTDLSTWTPLADKILVRDYIHECGLDDIQVPLLGTWGDANDIDFDSLPQKFVLKCNHDSASTHIIDKAKPFDKKAIIEDLNEHLKVRYGYWSVEPHYNQINPMILAEEYLDMGSVDFSSSVVDYKLFCYNGKPDMIMVIYNRHPGEYIVMEYFDLDWNYHPEWGAYDDTFRKGNGIVPRPESLDKMIDVACRLSKGFPEVRVDLYDVKGKIYFGELTFTSDCGRMPYLSDEYQLRAGAKIDLSLAKRIRR